MMKNLWLATVAVLLLAHPAPAATPAQKCASDKKKEAARYVECLQKAEAKLALTGDESKRTLAVQKCSASYRANWPRIEAKAGGACPSTGDQTHLPQRIGPTDPLRRHRAGRRASQGGRPLLRRQR